ncbi:hypothetical protein [Muricoccus aerilatus]|uniref:hypothetical protein n=1 Tax=Muricoccus aerilatus TaxID=452982 RepID=UPI0005C1AC22|nr:hypothetical protein [Roseomonas aerilata]
MDLYTRFVGPVHGYWLAVPVLLTLAATLRRSLPLGLAAGIGWSLFLGSVVAAVGGHIEVDYASAYLFWAKAAAAASPLLLLARWFEADRRMPELPTAAAVTVLTLVTLTQAWRVYASELAAAKVSPLSFHSAELGGYVHIAWKDYISFALSHRNDSVVEDYWGLWSAATRVRSPYPTDSAIHALGGTRELFAARFRAALPDFAVTPLPVQLGYFTGWLYSTNWWLYGSLLQHYSSEVSSPTTTLWRRDAAARTWPSVGCHVENGPDPAVIVESESTGYYEVTLSYEAHFARTTLLRVRNNINFAVDADGFLSIDPKAGQWVFPAAILVPGRNRLNFQLTARFDTLAGLQLRGCTAREIIVDQPTVFPKPATGTDDLPMDLTDGNWINGVYRFSPAFVIENSPSNRERLTPGTTLTFFDGKSLKIIRQDQNGPYLNVFLEGTFPLHGGHGFPHRFEVQRP